LQRQQPIGPDFWLFFGVVSLLRVLMLATFYSPGSAPGNLAFPEDQLGRPLLTGF
jgi:hypothetical protein